MSQIILERLGVVVIDSMRMGLLIDCFSVQAGEIKLGSMIQYVFASRTSQPFDFSSLVIQDAQALEYYPQCRQRPERNGGTVSLLSFYKWRFQSQ